MKTDIVVPSVGESITSGVITSWLKENGARVQEGEDLFELETDKATIVVPSSASGELEVMVAGGETVGIGQVVGRVETAVAGAEKEPRPPAKKGSVPAPQPAASQEHEAPKRKLRDVPETEATAAKAPSSSGRQTRVPMSLIRKKTAERLVAARRNAAHLTTFNEIDMGKVIEIRSHYREEFEKEHGIRIGFMSFFVKACCQALKAFPAINATIDGEDIVYNNFYDIGVAVSTDRGLIVPIIRDADRLSFAQIESAINSIATRAREKTLLPGELQGGTFTITNGGVFGSLLSTPIPAYPQTAILGMHVIKKRPVVAGDSIVIRPMMYVALTYDHRLVDGREAVRFLVRVKEFIEEPDKLLLET